MSGIQRFLSKRERNGDTANKRHSLHFPLNSSRNKSFEFINPESVVDFYDFFSDTATPNSVEEPKIRNLQHKIILSKAIFVKDQNILWCLRCNFSNGNADKAYDLLTAIVNASEGIIIPYDPSIKLLGAINRQATTCYLDSTLFAMFSKLDSFEAMLYNTFEDRSRNKLAFLLRIWVNLLRAGKLITTDVTKVIQETLAECGWEDAARPRQQDASEAFTFITEKLQLPLLTLKMDMFHAGKQDADDHRFINERLLEVAIPSSENGERKEVKLEDCLEEYFNNRIEVRRFLERRSTINSARTPDSPMKMDTIHVETVEIDDNESPLTPMSPLPPHMNSTRPTNRGRAPSIIQERFIPDEGNSKSDQADGNTEDKISSLRKGSVRKEVLMPAWQFFSLIPWYTNNAPSNDAQVAAHFSSKRPILGLCLKRYSMRPNGTAIRLNTSIDIPIEIGLPHFIQDDKMDDDGPLYGNFKLSLQSVVCHRGNSVNSGHYISLVRTKIPSPGSEANHWLRFDDVATQKVTLVNINRALKEETPYLLFYQIIPIEGDPGNLTAGEKPPSYSESQAHDSGISGMSTSPEMGRSLADSQPPSGRPSIELSLAEDLRTRQSSDTRRPSSVYFAEHLTIPKDSGSDSQERSNRNSISLGRSGSRRAKRLSQTFATLTGVTPRSRDSESLSSTSDPEISVTEIEATGQTSRSGSAGSIPPVKTTPAIDIPSNHLRDRSKTDKSRNRLSRVYGGKTKGEKPDRECNVM